MEVDKDGTKRWKLNGQFHREDGPAVVYADGHKEWWVHGQRHREDGPAIEWPNGDKWWYLHGQLHRPDGPAIERADGSKEWWLHGKNHREDGPAVEWPHGRKDWVLHGEILTPTEWQQKVAAMKKKAASTSTPAPKVESTQPVMEVDKYGTKIWKLNGQFHREDGPAVEYTNGDKFWYLHDKCHREDGPALEYANGTKVWWIHGEILTQTEWQQKVAAMKKKAESTSPPKVTTSPSMMDHIKSDLSQGTFRVAAKTIPKTARTALLAFLKAKKAPKHWLVTAQEVMATEYGLAMIQQALAWAFRYLPSLREDVRAQALANEWAIDSLAVVGNEVINEGMAVLSPIIAQVMELPAPQNIRVVSVSQENLEETEEETSAKRAVA
jgi:hypothetical protein